MTSLKTSIKTITYLSDIGCLEIQGASLERIRFVYLNVAYSQNPNNLMWQDNVDHTIHYLNLLQTDYQYYQPKNRESGRAQGISKLRMALDINPMLLTLLGVEKLLTKGKIS